jgi:hypothetical protein
VAQTLPVRRRLTVHRTSDLRQPLRGQVHTPVHVLEQQPCFAALIGIGRERQQNARGLGEPRLGRERPCVLQAGFPVFGLAVEDVHLTS